MQALPIRKGVQSENNNMSVFKRNGEGNFYIQFNFNGKTHIKSSKTTNKRVAERMERDWKQTWHRVEEVGDKPRIRLVDALKGYIEERKNTGSQKYSKNNAGQVFNNFDITMYVDELQDWHMAKFKTKREADGMAAATIKHNFQAIKSAIEWAKNQWRPKVRNESIIYMTTRVYEILKRRSEDKAGDYVFRYGRGSTGHCRERNITNAANLLFKVVSLGAYCGVESSQLV